MESISKNIGTLLHEAGKISTEDAEKIVIEQRRLNIRFGDAAVKLGFVSEDDISKIISEQFDYSYLSRKDDLISDKVVTAFNSQLESVELFRKLRAQLSLRWFCESKSIVFTSSSNSSGVSLVCANLAVAFAQLGQKTLLVDSNMRKPNIHSLFKIKNDLGLSDLLADRAGLDVIKIIKNIKNLSILTAGTTPPNPMELLGRNDNFIQLLISLENEYDVIIFDTPPSIEFNDSMIITSKVGGAVLVEKKNHSIFSELKTVKKEFAMNDLTIVGVILNEF